MKVCFYTNGHIGDLLITLPFIDLLIKKYPENEYYQFNQGASTNFDDSLISCIDNLKVSNELCGDVNIPTHMCDRQYSQWISPPDYPLIDHFSIMKFFWEKIYKLHGFDIEIPDNLGVNYNYNIDNKKRIESSINLNRKKVLIFNQKVRSSQTDNMDWKSYIVGVCNMFPDIDFFYTNHEEINLDFILDKNLFYTPEIYGKIRCDILENAYLSTLCDVLVGRCNGPYMYAAMHDKNIENKNMTMISQIHNNVHMDDLEIFYNRNKTESNCFHSKSSKQTFEILEKIL